MTDTLLSHRRSLIMIFPGWVFAVSAYCLFRNWGIQPQAAPGEREAS